MKLFPIWFKAEDVFIVRNKQVFCGPSPFEINKDNKEEWKQLFQKPLLITHEKARKDCFYKIVGIESWAISWIRIGQPIGIMVEPIEENKIQLSHSADTKRHAAGLYR